MKHSIIWEYHTKENKPYCVIFSTFTDLFRSCDITFYNTKDEALEEIELIKQVYKSIERPTKKGQKWDGNTNHHPENTYNFGDNQYFYGWVLVDFENEKFTIGKDGVRIKCKETNNSVNYFTINNKTNTLKVKDILFRKPNEVSFNYPWDDGEYEGWLQFRWGDGKNKIEGNTPQEIKKIERKKNYKPKDKYFKKLDDEELKQFENKYDQLQDDIQKQIDKKLPNELMDKYGW